MIKKHIPNALTCANLLSGCVGIVYAFQNRLDIAAYAVLISGIFDFFDGNMARILNVKSPIGKELDSLADMVSFGFLPGVVMFKLLEQSHSTFEYLPFFGFLITIFSCLRLAKFNIDTRQTEDFIGLNTPMNTLFIVSLPFIQREYPALIGSTLLLVCLTILMSWLLISEIRIYSLKFGTMSWADNKIKFVFLIVSAVLIAFLKFAAIPFVLILYILSSFVHFRNNPYN
ncbi:CDP-diacylglycerol--serine O-phosphatidyltransferase [Pedobacter quisquiliarum]|jgi:CDP-diacylglycerol--serine O-phosphatidyltransferase|uniref:CDP-diacylglycerol--serine O-phosphatidyltransferase n=1 Tax=Pedobacter quisquiliarum TaxID=1834438 RepID=A0A916U3I1_9SPHI|nr:CDP-diacylglycerol--serine O-phosphatidyltransferase [Pedobacter quisquiliarum]GGC58280.1 CDP-diacylglycerol--serine O-phosphatidyltransferase [Pedobacter quisquiliarum]